MSRYLTLDARHMMPATAGAQGNIRPGSPDQRLPIRGKS